MARDKNNRCAKRLACCETYQVSLKWLWVIEPLIKGLPAQRMLCPENSAAAHEEANLEAGRINLLSLWV